jgi:uncharacterized protein YdhG (YjbR/CyaY superfamily)
MDGPDRSFGIIQYSIVAHPFPPPPAGNRSAQEGFSGKRWTLPVQIFPPSLLKGLRGRKSRRLMQSKASDVTAYLREAPSERQEALARLRGLCLEVLAGYVEGMEYGLPGYRRSGGAIEVGFASQKNYISLYILKEDVMQANRGLLEGLSVGKGCIRYSSPKKMNFDVIRKLLEETVVSPGLAC